MAIMSCGLKSSRILGAACWHSLWTCHSDAELAFVQLSLGVDADAKANAKKALFEDSPYIIVRNVELLSHCGGFNAKA